MRKGEGGSYENIGDGRHWSPWGRWYRDAPKPTMHTRDYHEDDGKILYGPNDKPLKRIVDKRPRTGFKREADK